MAIVPIAVATGLMSIRSRRRRRDMRSYPIAPNVGLFRLDNEVTKAVLAVSGEFKSQYKPSSAGEAA